MSTATVDVKLKFRSIVPLREVRGTVVDDQARTIRTVIMTEGLGNLRDRNFYTKEAVRSCPKVFEGKQFYIDHPSAREEEERPERSVRDLAGYFYDVGPGTVVDPDTGEKLEASFATLKFANSEPGRLAFEQAKEALDYQKRFPRSKDVYAGISINGGGVSHPGTIRGMEVNVVTAIEEAFSADIVTKPARGGRFVALMREAARTAEWKRRRLKARETTRRRAGMSTATAVDPKVKKGVREARQALKHLGAAVETKKGDAIQGALKTLSEAFKRLDKPLEGDQFKEAKDRLAGAQKTLGKMVKAIEAGEEDMDPKTMVADIKSDVDALYDSVMGDEEGGGAAAEGVEGEGETEGGEGEGEEETETEGEGEEEDEELGMGSEEEDENGMMPRAMQYSCASCGETNRVMPPKGFKLARMGESAKDDPDGLGSTVRRLQKRLESKERRFHTHNQEMREVLKENAQLRATVLAQKRLELARKALREAGVPPDIMKPKELLPFEPDQWPAMIKVAKNAKAKESSLLNRGGAGPRGGSGGENGQGDAGKDAKATFKEAYQKPHDIVG